MCYALRVTRNPLARVITSDIRHVLRVMHHSRPNMRHTLRVTCHPLARVITSDIRHVLCVTRHPSTSGLSDYKRHATYNGQIANFH